MIWILPKGLAVGVAVAAPVGPIGLLCIKRTLDRRWTTGVASGLGLAVVAFPVLGPGLFEEPSSFPQLCWWPLIWFEPAFPFHLDRLFAQVFYEGRQGGYLISFG